MLGQPSRSRCRQAPWARPRLKPAGSSHPAALLGARTSYVKVRLAPAAMGCGFSLVRLMWMIWGGGGGGAGGGRLGEPAAARVSLLLPPPLPSPPPPPLLLLLLLLLLLPSLLPLAAVSDLRGASSYPAPTRSPL